MRLVDADELIEHAWRDKLDSRELIAEMIEKAPTIKEISTKIPINVFEQLISQEPKTGEWIEHFDESGKWYECDQCHTDWGGAVNFCPNCGADMRGEEV